MNMFTTGGLTATQTSGNGVMYGNHGDDPRAVGNGSSRIGALRPGSPAVRERIGSSRGTTAHHVGASFAVTLVSHHPVTTSLSPMV